MALAEKRQNEVEKFITGLKKIKSKLDLDELLQEMQKTDVKNPVTNKKCKQYTETWVCLAQAIDKVFKQSLFDTAIEEGHLTKGGNPKRGGSKSPSSVKSDTDTSKSDSSSGTKRAKKEVDPNAGQFKYANKTMKLTGDMEAVVRALEALVEKGEVQFVGKKAPKATKSAKVPKKKDAAGWKHTKRGKFELPAGDFYMGDMAPILEANKLDLAEGHFIKDNLHIIAFKFDDATHFKMDGDEDDDTIFNTESGYIGIASETLAKNAGVRDGFYSFEEDVTVKKSKDHVSFVSEDNEFDIVKVAEASKKRKDEELVETPKKKAKNSLADLPDYEEPEESEEHDEESEERDESEEHEDSEEQEVEL